MSDTKMLQAILDGQRAVKEELKRDIKRVDERVTSMETQMKEGFQEVNGRLDKIGKSVTYLEDDTPTIDEFNGLVRRVSKLENRVFKN